MLEHGQYSRSILGATPSSVMFSCPSLVQLSSSTCMLKKPPETDADDYTSDTSLKHTDLTQ